MQSALPIMLGYFPLAFAYGVLAIQAGLPVAATVGMSVFVYAGASQFMAVGMLATGSNPMAIVFATLVVNLRHILMSAAIGPRIGGFSRLRLGAIAFHLTDETFAVMSLQNAGPFTSAWLGGLQWGAYLSWVAGSAVGAVAGSVIGDPARWGLDFALVAMFMALLSMQVRHRKSLLVAITAAITYRLALLWVPGHWSIILAAFVATTVGTMLEQKHQGFKPVDGFN